jgi:hypothetical protein
MSVFYKLISLIWNKEEVPDQYQYQFTRRVIKLTVIIIVGYHCYQLCTKPDQMSFFHSYVQTEMKLLGTISLDFDVTEQIFLNSSGTEKSGSTMKQYISFHRFEECL